MPLKNRRAGYDRADDSDRRGRHSTGWGGDRSAGGRWRSSCCWRRRRCWHDGEEMAGGARQRGRMDPSADAKNAGKRKQKRSVVRPGRVAWRALGAWAAFTARKGRLFRRGGRTGRDCTSSWAPRMPSSAQGKQVVRGVAQVWAGGREVDSTTRRGGSSERARTLAGSVAS